METQDRVLEAIFDQAAVGIAEISLDGKWLRVNKRYCQMLGYSESELRTKTLKDITHPDDCAGVLETRRQLLEGTISSHSMDKRYIRRDGTVFWGRLNRSLVRDECNQPQFFIAVVEDITEKVQFERALRDREQQLLMAQSAARLGLWDHDLRTNITVTSGHYGPLRGLKPDQRRITHDEWVAMIHPDDRERVQADLQECLVRKHIWDEEFRVVWPDGSVHWLLAKGQVFLDAAGIPVRMAGASLDITERKQVEEALRESERRFRNMADAAPVMIWVSGADKLCTFFNKPWLDFTGRILEQQLGEGWANGVHPDDLDRRLAAYQSAFDARCSFRLEYRLRRADGEYRWVLDSGTPVYRGGEFAGFVGSCIDITEQKLIEERLRDSERRLVKAQHLAKVGSWERDLAADRILWSDEMYQILGTPEGVPSSLGAFLNCVHPEDRKRIFEADREIRSTNGPVEVEYRIIRPNGEVRFLRSAVEAIRSDEGVPARIVGATQDITEIRRAQEESFARQKLEGIGTLAAGIAHDFNNLLGGVLAQAEMGLGDLASGSNPEPELKMIRDVALRGSEIVRELMIFAGKESAVVELVDVSRIVREMLELLKLSVSKRAVIIADLSESLPAVRANAAQLRQIAMNLVTNASDAIGDRDGVIRVITRKAPLGKWVPSESLSADDHLILEVSDTGCGMSTDTQNKVFDPFFTTKSAGRGLGLAIVSGIVRSIGGALRVTSELGKGSTFQILLPCAETTEGAVFHGRSTIMELVGQSPQAAVLVVEDEDVLREAVAKTLRKNGFEVFEAANGSSAIDLLRTNQGRIEVILLDVTIPGASSREVVAEAANIRPDTRVVLTSAYSQEMLPTSPPQIRSFIRKPFQLADLVKTLRNSLVS